MMALQNQSNLKDITLFHNLSQRHKLFNIRISSSRHPFISQILSVQPARGLIIWSRMFLTVNSTPYALHSLIPLLCQKKL